MAVLGDVYAALPAFRVALQEKRAEAGFLGDGLVHTASAQTVSTPFSATASPFDNVHATGVGVRVRKGKVVANDFVLKVYVFNKVDLGTGTPDLTRNFGNVEVDVEALPIQLALNKSGHAKVAAVAPQAVPANRSKHRPIVGGLSIAPVNEGFVGTLGCFVGRRVAGSEQVFALSNNHVLADTNRLPMGTAIVQPGPETGPSSPGDAFAALSEIIPIRFPTGRFDREANRFDAAIARVTDLKLIKRGTMFGTAYDPQLATPLPGMKVTKSGRTTGVTHGTVTAVGVNGVQVNYGTPTNPIIATFNDTIEVVGDGGGPFSLPGDSGSAILDSGTGRPVGLLFAGDGYTTTACSIAGVCRHFQVLPI